MLVSLALIAAVFCSGAVLAQTQAPAPEMPAALLTAAKSWGYQLQKIRPAMITDAPYDVFVLDYSRDGTDEHALTAEDIAALKLKPDGSRRIVLAYLSIGEAETYRYYWQWYWDPALLVPPFLADTNKSWKTNVRVRYWHEQWQAIIFRGERSYLERIIAAGFDGVYLDRVDVHQEFEKENPAAREQMVAFVKALAARVRERKPGFLVVPQNAEELLEEADYRAVIDAIAKEDLLFGDGRPKYPNKPERIAHGVGHLKLLAADRKPVFVVEYIDKPEDVATARRQIEDYGFIAHFADRNLETMRIGDLPPARPRPAPKSEKAGKNGKK